MRARVCVHAYVCVCVFVWGCLCNVIVVMCMGVRACAVKPMIIAMVPCQLLACL